MPSETKRYRLPAYMDDAPPIIQSFVHDVAREAVKAMCESIRECEPNLNPDSLEFAQIVGAAFHVAAQIAVDDE